nr:hypothetical protein Itr_chr02CG16470 [Ipomoea trifida]
MVLLQCRTASWIELSESQDRRQLSTERIESAIEGIGLDRLGEQRHEEAIGDELIGVKERQWRFRHRKVEVAKIREANTEESLRRGECRIHFNEGSFIGAPERAFRIHRPAVGEALNGERVRGGFHGFEIFSLKELF